MPPLSNSNQRAAPLEKPHTRSPARVTAMLECLAQAGSAGLSLSELAAAQDAPKTSLVGLLNTLLDTGYLVREGRQYRLGPAAYRLAAAIGWSNDVHSAARPVMEQLVRDCGETVMLGTLSDDAKVQFVDRVDSPQAVRFSVPIGARHPLYCSAAGRVLLAWQPEAWRERYFKSTPLTALTPRTETRVRELKHILDHIRATGLCATNEQSARDVAGFAAPVFGRDGTVQAGLVIATLATRGLPRAAELGKAVRAAAAGISRTLGYAETIDPPQTARKRTR